MPFKIVPARAATFAIALVAAVVSACAAPPVLPVPAPDGTTQGDASATATARATRSSCPDEAWVPFDVTSIPGITAVSTDRATVVVTNRTGRQFFYRLGAWERSNLEPCRTLVESEIERGPIGAGETITTTLGPFIDRVDMPVTIAFWADPCGEGCKRPPIAGFLIDRSDREPVAS